MLVGVVKNNLSGRGVVAIAGHGVTFDMDENHTPCVNFRHVVFKGELAAERVHIGVFCIVFIQSVAGLLHVEHETVFHVLTADGGCNRYRVRRDG